jgi:hypothetical protein
MQPIQNGSLQKGNSIVRGKQLRKHKGGVEMIEIAIPVGESAYGSLQAV